VSQFLHFINAFSISATSGALNSLNLKRISNNGISCGPTYKQLFIDVPAFPSFYEASYKILIFVVSALSVTTAWCMTKANSAPSQWSQVMQPYK